MKWGGAAVAFFFLTSAFLLFYNMTENNISHKIINRFKSLVIPFFIWNVLYFIIFSIREIKNPIKCIEKFFLTPYCGVLWFVEMLLFLLVFVRLNFLIMKTSYINIICLIVAFICSFYPWNNKISNQGLWQVMCLFSLLNLISNILLFQSWIPSMNVYFSLNGVAWYLSTILFLYIVFPVILSKIRKLNSIRSAIIVAGIVYTLQIVCGYCAQIFINNTNIDIPDFVHWFTYICPLFRMGDFLIGCLFGYIFIKTEHSNNQVQGTLLELFPFLILIVVQLLNANNILFFNMDFFQNTIMYIPIASCFVFNFARNEGIVSRLLVCKPIMYIGDFSNYNFLIHGIVIAYVTTFSLWLGRPLSPLYKFLIALPISLLCSYIYIRIEQFITVKLKQKMKR